MNKLLIITLVVTILGYGYFSSDKNNSSFTLEGEDFVIPNTNIIQPNIIFISSIWDIFKEPEKDLLIIFRAEDIQKSIPNYKTNKERFRTNIISLLTVFKTGVYSNTLKIYHDNVKMRFDNIWYEKEDYKDQIVKFDKKHKMYRIYSEIGYPTNWIYLDIKPDKHKTVPFDFHKNFYILCSIGTTILTSSKKLTTCDTSVSWGKYYVDFSITLDNLPYLREIQDFIRGEIIKWHQENNKKDSMINEKIMGRIRK